jgi:DNA-binding HxlR family transcriptional regulator
VKWDEYDTSSCSVARTLEVLGDRWTLLVLRDIFNGVRRFDDLSRHLHVARDVLTRRLANLVDEGVLLRVPYQEPGSRTRYEYRLTEAGLDLRPVMLALMEWGDRYRPDEVGPPAGVIHYQCGEPVRVRVECAAGHEVRTDTRLRLVPGPGARLLAPTDR